MTSRWNKEILKAVRDSAALEGIDSDRAYKNKKVKQDIKCTKAGHFIGDAYQDNKDGSRTFYCKTCKAVRWTAKFGD